MHAVSCYLKGAIMGLRVRIDYSIFQICYHRPGIGTKTSIKSSIKVSRGCYHCSG